MKAAIEKALAGVIEESELLALAMVEPSYSGRTAPDAGTTVVVIAEIEHRAGPLHVADVTFEIATVRDDQPETEEGHRLQERALQAVVGGITTLECGEGVTISGPPFFQGQSGGIEDNRWVSNLKFRWGVMAV
jgi:hypothetical protein